MKTSEKSNISIEDVKSEISENVGKQIIIKESNRQGKKIKEYKGIILNAYASLFIVRVQIRENFLNKSFSYVDFLTNELTFEIEN
ncbi:MAG: Veg family protein [Clostridia bacterium]|nr:Veg family protein [Clostridia bacterium]